MRGGAARRTVHDPAGTAKLCPRCAPDRSPAGLQFCLCAGLQWRPFAGELDGAKAGSGPRLSGGPHDAEIDRLAVMYPEYGPDELVPSQDRLPPEEGRRAAELQSAAHQIAADNLAGELWPEREERDAQIAGEESRRSLDTNAKADHPVIDLAREPGHGEAGGSRAERNGIAMKAEERFDAVLMLGNNLGLLEGPERASEHLEWLAARCRPGALLVGESIDITRKGPEYLAYFRHVAAAGRVPGQLRLRLVFEGQTSDWFFYWQLTPDDLRNVVRNTPWHIERIEPIVGADRYVAVLQRY